MLVYGNNLKLILGVLKMVFLPMMIIEMSYLIFKLLQSIMNYASWLVCKLYYKYVFKTIIYNLTDNRYPGI